MRHLAAAAVCVAAAASVYAASPAVEEAQALFSQGEADRALKRLEIHLAGSPQDAEGRFLRGLILVRLGRTEEAMRTFADLTRDYPQLPEPYNNLAVLYAQQGDYEKARDALEAALATHPSYGTAHENLGDIYAALAGAAYNRALMLDQNNQSARHKLNLISQLNSLQGGPANQARAPAGAGPSAAAAPASAAEADGAAAAVQAWASAWSGKDADTYLAFYGPDFQPEAGLAREEWERQRRDRIARPNRINVRVVEPQVQRDGELLRVSFRQEYESDLLSNSVGKVLELKDYGGSLKIVREYSR